MGATLSLAHRRSMDPDHILYGLLSGSSDTRQVKLRSDARLCQLRGISWTTLPDLASAPLNGQITNGKRSTVKMLPGSVLLCPRPVPSLLGWAVVPEQGEGGATGAVLPFAFQYDSNEAKRLLCNL